MKHSFIPYVADVCFCAVIRRHKCIDCSHGFNRVRTHPGTPGKYLNLIIRIPGLENTLYWNFVKGPGKFGIRANFCCGFYMMPYNYC